jgi:multidrug transporter EmrE-like cation transporter
MYRKRYYQKKSNYNKYATKKRIPTIHKRSGFTGKSLKGIIGAPNGLYNQRFGQRQEQKFFDTLVMGTNNSTESSLTIIPNTPGFDITCINGIAEGADYYQRVGRNVSMKSIYVNLLFRIQEDDNNLNLAAATQYDSTTTTYNTQIGMGFVRVLVVYDLQTNGAMPDISTILYQNAQNGSGVETAGTADVTSFMNLNYRDRFKIIMDKKISLNAFGSTGTYVLKKYKKLSTGVTYNSGIGGIGSINTGAVYMLIFGQGASDVYGYGRTRIRFTDA